MAICPAQFFAKARAEKHARLAGHFPWLHSGLRKQAAKPCAQGECASTVTAKNITGKSSRAASPRYPGASTCHGGTCGCVAKMFFGPVRKYKRGRSLLANHAVLAVSGLPSRGGTHMLLRDFSCMGQWPAKFAACGFAQDQNLAGRRIFNGHIGRIDRNEARPRPCDRHSHTGACPRATPCSKPGACPARI